MKTHSPENYLRITIVTPSFNQGRYLRDTIESILNQDYPNLEYIIMDGGSTDRSVEIIREYQDHIDYWVSEKDKGQSDAINKGLKRATGNLCNWINSDDVLFPNALYRIAEAFARHPGADLIIGSQAFCDMGGRVKHISVVPSAMAISVKNWVIPIGQQSTFFSARAYRRVGGVREDLHAIMDREFYYRVLASGGRIARAKGLIGMIRIHPESKTETRRDLWHEEIPRFLRKNQIPHLFHRISKLKMRIVKCFDGSYLNSLLLSQSWKGKKLWGKE